MGILLSFAPWLLYWGLLSFHRLESAAIAGLAATLIMVIVEVARGRSLKILPAGSLVYFLLLALAIPSLGARPVGRWVDLAGGAALALIVLISILVGKPFTLQYARETAPRERWNDPVFFRKNLVISWVWFGAFLVNLGVPVSKRLGLELPLIANWVVSMCTFIAAMRFTHWYARPRG
ncbi:MAG: hypothetical protein WCP22_04275 [Chlamydiota bacterium]